MRVEDFDYELPESLIARHPPARRGDSRLLALGAADARPRDLHFSDLPRLLRPGDLLVFNDTRVIPARLLGRKETGGRVEVLVERLLEGGRALAHVRASKAPRPGMRLSLEEGAVQVRVEGRAGALFQLRFLHETPVLELLERHGRVPLPPYLARAEEAADRSRYQTVFARRPGAVAAPTAGLHFDEAMLARLREMGVAQTFVTLHVGAGTFQPVRVTQVEAHEMHAEWLRVPEEAVAAVAEARARGGRVVAVGTTAVRALESAAAGGRLVPFEGDTRLFIYPGYRFRVVEAMITNFHLPRSTLLMLVSAFAGRERVLAAYRHAVAQGYRFFSYGDAMWLERRSALDEP